MAQAAIRSPNSDLGVPATVPGLSDFRYRHVRFGRCRRSEALSLDRKRHWAPCCGWRSDNQRVLDCFNPFIEFTPSRAILVLMISPSNYWSKTNRWNWKAWPVLSYQRPSEIVLKIVRFCPRLKDAWSSMWGWTPLCAESSFIQITYWERWRRERDSNPRYAYAHNGFRVQCIPTYHVVFITYFNIVGNTVGKSFLSSFVIRKYENVTTIIVISI